MLREDQHSECFHALPVNHGLCADACPHLRPDRVVVGPGVIGGDAAAEHCEPAYDDPVERVLVANGRASVAGMALERVHETTLVERVEHGKMAERSTVEIAGDDDRLVWRGECVFVGANVGESDGDFSEDTALNLSVAATYAGADWRVGPSVSFSSTSRAVRSTTAASSAPRPKRRRNSSCPICSEAAALIAVV